MKPILCFTTLLFSAATVSAQVSPERIRAILKHEVEARRSKSIIVGIIDAKGRQVFAEGVLSDENPVPPDSNTLYEIGSITKVFTTLLLADMHLRKELDIQNFIGQYLPKTVKPPVRNGKEITLLNLATHRSGFPRTAFNLDPKNPDNPYTDYSLQQLYAFVNGVQLNRDIDSRWQYSNIGYTLLGQILSVVGQKSYEDLVQERICGPLQLNSTFFKAPKGQRYTIAQGHTEYGAPAAAWDLLPLAGGGGQRSNVKNMLTFAAANLGLINSELQPAMELCHQLQAKKDGNDEYMTMGWTLKNDDGKEILYKDGGTGGYRTFLGIDKINKRAVVVLSNSNNGVTDIGVHLLDSSARLKPYHYRWALLDTLRSTMAQKGVEVGLDLYRQLKASGNPDFLFNEHQLNHLGNEWRRAKKIKDAIKIFELNRQEYPQSAMVYESLAETYRRSGQKQKAIPYLEQAQKLEPQNQHWTWLLQN